MPVSIKLQLLFALMKNLPPQPPKKKKSYENSEMDNYMLLSLETSQLTSYNSYFFLGKMCYFKVSNLITHNNI